MKKKNKILITLIQIVLIAVIIFSGIKIIEWIKSNKKNKDIMSEIKENVVINNEMDSNNEEYKIDFAKLKQKNSDAIAWIKVNGTDIDFPVVKGTDNSYYLTHNFDKEKNKAGWIFADYRNKFDGTDKNIIIYGHNMKNGSMFAQLHKFEDPDFFDANREVVIYLPGEVLHYTIFAAHIYDDRHLLYSFDFTNPEVYQKYLDSIFSTRDMSANIDKDITVTTDNQIITLVTCIGSQPNNRLLVQAVLTDRELGAETALAAAATE